MASYNQPTHSILLLEHVRLKLNYPINQFASFTFRWVRPRFFAIANLAANFLPFYYASGIGMPGFLCRWLLKLSAPIGPIRKSVLLFGGFVTVKCGRLCYAYIHVSHAVDT